MQQRCIRVLPSFCALLLFGLSSLTTGTGVSACDAASTVRPAESGATTTVGPRSSIWHVSARHLSAPDPRSAELPDLYVERISGDGRWDRSSVEEFFGADEASAITCIYVNGSRVTPRQSLARGIALYDDFTTDSTIQSPVRFVIWSWPTPKSRRLLRDFHAAVNAADPHSAHLAWFLSQFDRDARVSLLGYSFGARVITGALHLLAGGHLNAYQLPQQSGPQKLRTVLWAAALHDDWLMPGRYHGQALERVDRLLLVNNSCDRALRSYHFLWPRERPSALGYAGLPMSSALGIPPDDVQQIDACEALGSVHSFESHRTSQEVVTRTRQHLLWDK